jgi:hypothetical protein
MLINNQIFTFADQFILYIIYSSIHMYRIFFRLFSLLQHRFFILPLLQLLNSWNEVLKNYMKKEEAQLICLRIIEVRALFVQYI